MATPEGYLEALSWASVNASQAPLIVDLQQQIVALKHQLDWLKRQLFGTKRTTPDRRKRRDESGRTLEG